MNEVTEQERLASLIGGDGDKEPVDTGDILAESLKAALGNPLPHQIEAATRDIESHGDVATTIKKVGSSTQAPSIRHSSTEKILTAIYDVRDNLIDAFGGCKLNSALSDNLSQQINALGSCIVNLGGNADPFDPLNHVSGLEMPDNVKNAEEVVERTMQCYKLGTIEKAQIHEDGKEINIVFSGKEGSMAYKATGRIIAKAWTGNEAIDYVYTPNAGKMSVKSFEGGRWVNRSDTKNYHISWELSEQDLTQVSAKTSSNKEEVTQTAQNNDIVIQDADGEEDIGSPLP